jgi:hypothetical protein
VLSVNNAIPIGFSFGAFEIKALMADSSACIVLE